MAEIRTERKKGTAPWVWVLLAVVLIALAVAALVWLGYIEMPGAPAATGAVPAAGQGLAAVPAHLMRSI